MFYWEIFDDTERGLREKDLVFEANIYADSIASEELLIDSREVPRGKGKLTRQLDTCHPKDIKACYE